MTKKEVRRSLDSDIMYMLDRIIESKENGFNTLIPEYCIKIRGILWAANSLGLLNHDEWRTANRMIIHLEYHY